MATTPAAASTFLVDTFQLATTESNATSTPPIVIDLTSVDSLSDPFFHNVRTGEGFFFLASEVNIDTETFSGLTTKGLTSAWMIGDEVSYIFFEREIGGLNIGTVYYLTGPINPVPIPAAAWLFGTALIGLVGFGRRKAT